MINYQDEITQNLIVDLGLKESKHKLDNHNIHVYLPNKNIVSMNYKISGDSVRFKGELQVANPVPNRPGVYTYKKINKVIDERDGFIVKINDNDTFTIKEAARKAVLNNKYHWFLMTSKIYLAQIGVVV